MQKNLQTFLDAARIKEIPQHVCSAENRKNEPEMIGSESNGMEFDEECVTIWWSILAHPCEAP
jgi:hypothetical protein